MTEQSEVQRLAAALDALLGYRGINADVGKAAAELRRLDAVNAQLLKALKVARREAICWYAESWGFDPEVDELPDWLIEIDAAIKAAKGEA
jgi:hypothetical protein